MKCEFKEKHYETYFNIEMARLSDFVFPSDPILEADVGFDSSFMCTSDIFWDRVRWAYRPGAIFEIEDEPHIFPNVSLNLFIQYKRPEFMTRASSSEWEEWGQEYYRYEIETEQQQVLSEFYKVNRRDCLVLYSCPVYIKSETLFSNYQNQRIIEESNFVTAENLDNHHRYSFVNTRSGKAHSETEEIGTYDLKGLLKDRKEATGEGQWNPEQLIKISNSIDEIILDSKYKQDFNKILKSYEIDNLNEIRRSVLKLKIFSFLTHTNWRII